MVKAIIFAVFVALAIPAMAGEFEYNETIWLDYAPMAGVAYRSGPWSMHFQLWRMEGRTRQEDAKSAAPAFNENFQATLMVGYSF